MLGDDGKGIHYPWLSDLIYLFYGGFEYLIS